MYPRSPARYLSTTSNMVSSSPIEVKCWRAYAYIKDAFRCNSTGSAKASDSTRLICWKMTIRTSFWAALSCAHTSIDHNGSSSIVLFRKIRSCSVGNSPAITQLMTLISETLNPPTRTYSPCKRCLCVLAHGLHLYRAIEDANLGFSHTFCESHIV